jgi:hypothetical protein
MSAFLLVIAALLQITGSSIYMASILRGRSKPHRVTRLVLAFVLLLSFTSVLAAHGNLGAKLYGGITAAFGVGFFLLSIKKGMGGAKPLDWICFALAMIGVISWQITNNPLLGIWLASLADLVAYLPAFVKTWQHPHTESPWLYSLAAVGVFLSIIAYPISAVSAFQFVILGTSLAMLLCIYHESIPGFSKL